MMSPVKCIFLLLLFFFFHTSFSQSPVIDSLQKIIDVGKNDIEDNKALNAIAVEYTRIDMVKAKDYLNHSMKLAMQLNDPVQLANAYAQMVTLHSNTGKKDSARYYLQLLKALAGTSYKEEIIKANFNYAAGLFYRKQGNYKEALPYMMVSLNDDMGIDRKFKTAATRTSIAGQCLNIGNTYTDLGDYTNALKYHIKSLQIFEELGNKRGISFCYQGIASDFIQLGRYNEAIPYITKSAALKTELNDKRGIAISSGNYANAYKGLGDYGKAVYYMNDALQSFHEMKLLPDEAKADIELGKLYVQKNDARLAGQYFNKAAAIAVQLRDSSLQLTIDAEKMAMKNSIDLQKKESQKLAGSLQNAVEMGDKSKELISYQHLADYYANNKQFEKALDYTRKLYETTDSVGNKNLQLQIKKMEQQYNIEKKENEIALLKKDRQLDHLNLQKQKNFQVGSIIFLLLLLLIGFLLINRYNVMHRAKRIIDIERMRNSIAADLHDDIGSTLTSINIISKVALQRQGSGEAVMLSGMQKIKDRSSAIMESVSDIVWAISPQNDSMEQMICRMKEFTAEMLEPLNIKYSFKEEGDLSSKLGIKKRKDFYLLFKEAINNAAKYSRCNNLTIHLKQEGLFLHLSVKDDGAGFNVQEIKNGNGLRNMHERAASMGAKISIDTAIDKGTGILVDVPIT